MRYYWQIIIYVFIAIQAMSQGSGIYLASLGCQAVIPDGPLKRHFQKVRPGFSLHVMKQLGHDKPLFAGLGMDYHNFGTRKANIEELLDFKTVEFNYSTTSHSLSIYGSLRYYLPIQFLPAEIYTEGIVGIRTFFTNTSKTLASDEEFSDLYTERSDAASFYGIGLGGNLPVGKSVYLHLSGQYQWIRSASYDLPIMDGIAEFSSADLFIKKQSSIEYIMLGAGITLKIDSKQ